MFSPSSKSWTDLRGEPELALEADPKAEPREPEFRLLGLLGKDDFGVSGAGRSKSH